MKKILVLTMMLVMVLALCACGDNTNSNEVTIDEMIDYMVENEYGEVYTANIKDTKYLSDGEPVYLIYMAGPDGYLWSGNECIVPHDLIVEYYTTEGMSEEYAYENLDEIYEISEDWMSEW